MKVPVSIITNHFSMLDIEKYQAQYKNVHITKSTAFHDRFIILDRKILYHCGASFKDLGRKCFAINKIEEKRCLEELLNCQNLTIHS